MVNVWNSLLDWVLSAHNTNILKIDWINIGNIKTLYMMFRHIYEEPETEVILM